MNNFVHRAKISACVDRLLIDRYDKDREKEVFVGMKKHTEKIKKMRVFFRFW